MCTRCDYTTTAQDDRAKRARVTLSTMLDSSTTLAGRVAAADELLTEIAAYRADYAAAERYNDACDERSRSGNDAGRREYPGLTHLRGLVAEREHIEHKIERDVLDSAEFGESWGAIADVLGVSRQAAHKRYARRGGATPEAE